MCGAEGDDTGYPKDLQDDALCVGEELSVAEGGESVPSHHLIQLLLNQLGYSGVPQHVHHTPLQSGLDGLHAGSEEVSDHLLDLAVRVLASEHLTSLGSALLDLQDVGVHQVADVGGIERLPVVVHRLLEELCHFTAVL